MALGRLSLELRVPDWGLSIQAPGDRSIWPTGSARRSTWRTSKSTWRTSTSIWRTSKSIWRTSKSIWRTSRSISPAASALAMAAAVLPATTAAAARSAAPRRRRGCCCCCWGVCRACVCVYWFCISLLLQFCIYLYYGGFSVCVCCIGVVFRLVSNFSGLSGDTDNTGKAAF